MLGCALERRSPTAQSSYELRRLLRNNNTAAVPLPFAGAESIGLGPSHNWLKVRWHVVDMTAHAVEYQQFGKRESES